MNFDFSPYSLIDTFFSSKHRASRIRQYIDWLNATGQHWFNPDLSRYLDYLISLQTLQPSSIQARIAAVRSRYHEILYHPDFHKLLHNRLPPETSNETINEYVDKMREAADPRKNNLKYERETRKWNDLTVNHLNVVLNTPDLQSPKGIRDLAIIALFLFTGMRETEMKLLRVEDLRLSNVPGQSSIQIPTGEASSERFLPIYPQFPIQLILEAWLRTSAIQTGPLFRGFYKGGKQLRNTAITLQGVEDIFHQYPVEIDGKLTPIKAFELRRYYAQMLNSLDYEITTIAQNMGVRPQTVSSYIGVPSKQDHAVPSINLTKLERNSQ